MYRPKVGDRVRVLAIHPNDTTPEHAVGDIVEVSNEAYTWDGDFIYLYSRDEKNKLLLTYARVKEVAPAAPPIGVVAPVPEVDPVPIIASSPVPPVHVYPVPDDDPIGIDQSILPTDYDERKALLVAAVLDYFPLAIVAVSRVIGKGQAQHGTVGWDRAKSADEDNTMIRHFLERGTIDTDGVPHSAKMAWRALAILQKEEERRLGVGISRGSYDSSKGEKGPRGV